MPISCDTPSPRPRRGSDTGIAARTLVPDGSRRDRQTTAAELGRVRASPRGRNPATARRGVEARSRRRRASISRHPSAMATCDAHMVGTGMLGDVRQRFLHESIRPRSRCYADRLAVGRDLQGAVDRQALDGAHAGDERFERRNEAELVQCRRTQLRDDRSQVLDLALDLLQPRRAAAPAVVPRLDASQGRRQDHPQATETLQGLVMELARPASPLGLGGIQRMTQALCAATVWARTTAVAPLAANARSVISSSSENPSDSMPWSNAASTPSVAPAIDEGCEQRRPGHRAHPARRPRCAGASPTSAIRSHRV